MSFETNDQTALCVEDSRMALAWVSAAHYGHPSKNMNLVGVTGTNGKTTLTYILEAMYQTRNAKTGVIGTINYRYGDFQAQASVTTPESLDINRMLADMAAHGVKDCFLEVSSHSLALSRVTELHFSLGIFTNLSRDHLDYHIDMEQYKDTKKKFFQDAVMEQQVINIDDPVGKEIVGETNRPTLTTGIDQMADIRRRIASFPKPEANSRSKLRRGAGRYAPAFLAGTTFTISSVAQEPPMPRGFRWMRSKKDLKPSRIFREDSRKSIAVRIFQSWSITRTRMKPLKSPDRRESADQKNVVVVFGCGGDRDRGKRREMGRVALKLSDFTVITSDNPRSEDPDRIIEDILKGIPASSRKPQDYIVLPDRKQAIEHAIENARLGDLILIAGKGHENYQILNSETIHFDDKEIAMDAITQRMRRD